IPTIVSRSERRVPAARMAPNDEPYSTTRPPSRCHQTRCGMWCTPGCAPVAMDVRHTGVSDGNVVTARRYEPASASAESVGAERSPTAFSKVDGVRPSMMMRTALRLLRKRAQAGVLLARALPGAQADHRDRDRFDEADDGDERQGEREDGDHAEDRRRASGCAAAPDRAARERSGAEAAEHAGDRPGRTGLPVEEEPADEPAADECDRGRQDRCARGAREGPRRSEAQGDADPGADADQPKLVHEVRSVVSCAHEAGRTTRGSGPGP